MIHGIGTDLIEIKRVRQAAERTPGFLRRCFTEEERAYWEGKNQRPEVLAGLFAAKEAAVKALGGGFIREVEVFHEKSGAPSLRFHGKTALKAEGLRAFVSITHCKAYAAAEVLLEEE